MNKKIEEYKKKSNRIVKTIKLIGILIFLLGIIISIIQYTLNKSKSNQENQNALNGDSDYVVDLKNNTVIYQSRLDINLNIKNFEENSKYKMIVKINDVIVIERESISAQNKFSIELLDEGKHYINMIVYKNDKENYNKTLIIYYVNPYEKQFLDESSVFGTQVNYINGSRERYESSLNLIKYCGFKNIRAGLLLGNIWKNDGNYNYGYYDEWINKVREADINILALITNVEKVGGDDYIINTDEENKAVLEYILKLKEKYGDNIKWFEILNEPNYGTYYTDDEIKKYSNLVNTISNQINNIIVGATSGLEQTNDKYCSSIDFFNIVGKDTYNNSRIYSLHPYDIENWNNSNNKLNRLSKSHKEFFNGIGGFVKVYATEYGITSSTSIAPKGINETIQAYKIVEQSVIMNKNDIGLAIQYLFCNTGNDLSNNSYNYGLLNNDYTPKPSYYAMKNYLTNTNGSEYTGNLNLQEGLEAHIYNKDGKPLLIAWSNNTNNTYDFTLNNMKAKDIYGKEITPDETGKITITTSPVYLYNVDTNYFYKSISNVATTKYQEFETNFQDQISKVPGLQSSINTLKQRMQNFSTVSNLDETTAINLMKQHYNLGNTIIQSYKSKTLQIEFVKLSSMLDAIDDIGNSLEDLVTVSAKTRNANLTETQKLITEAENLTNDTELEMIYPNKILQFSKDYYEKSSYINSVKEENDIKTGLIVSKNLHSKLLAEWSIQFANLYIDDYITTNPVQIIYTTTAPTNQNVIATLQTNANITITNNSNSKTHTFEENGTFTFEYTIKGQAFQKTATVNNIDKKAPVITEVQNGRLYTQNITPKIYDENLQEVLLYKDNILSQNYKTNTTISEDGSYRLIATDKAGNQTTIEFDICKNPAMIKYSTKELTNQDVTVTLDSKYEIEETNNSNKTTYTFTENGEFTFKFKIKGTELRLTAYVGNIDKTPPTITGVENGRLYMDKATPIITDENLKGVKLYLNSHEVENYTSGIELTEEGFYKIIAIDNAGNETITEFAIMESMDREYKIKDNYILNIKNNTNKSDFDKNLKMPIKYEIFRDENKLTENDKIATGDLLITDGGERYTLIVNGDMNKDGYVNIKDVIKLRKYLLERNNIDEVSLLAADCNLDGKSINIKDLIKMRLIVLQRDVT